MALKYGTNNVTNLVYNGNNVTELIKDGTIVWEKPYVLTISATNTSYIASYSVRRISTKEPTASTRALSNNSTIYNKDDLIAFAIAAATSYGSWSITSINAPEQQSVSNDTITVRNSNGCEVTAICEDSSGLQQRTTIPASLRGTFTGLKANTSYSIYFTVSRTRPKYTHSVSQSFSTTTVSGNTTCNFTGSRTTTTESGTLNSSTINVKTLTSELSAPVFTGSINPSSIACEVTIKNNNGVSVSFHSTYIHFTSSENDIEITQTDTTTGLTVNRSVPFTISANGSLKFTFADGAEPELGELRGYFSASGYTNSDSTSGSWRA